MLFRSLRNTKSDRTLPIEVKGTLRDLAEYPMGEEAVVSNVRGQCRLENDLDVKLPNLEVDTVLTEVEVLVDSAGLPREGTHCQGDSRTLSAGAVSVGPRSGGRQPTPPILRLSLKNGNIS